MYNDREYGAQLVEELGVVELIGGMQDDGWNEDVLHQKHGQAGRIWIGGIFVWVAWSKKYSLDVVLVDDGEGGVVEVHEGLVNPPGHVGDERAHKEQEAGLGDEECQPLHALGLRCQCNDWVQNVKMILKTLRRTARKIVAESACVRMSKVTL